MTDKVRLATKAGTVALSMLGEKLWARPARTPEDVPADVGSLTNEWLTAILCTEHPGAEVVGFSSPSGSIGTSTRNALRLEYNEAGREAGLPTALFSKTTAAFRQRMTLGSVDVLHGETHFFTKFRPKVDMEAPIGYWGGVDDRSWRSMVLLEDIAHSKGARFIDPATPLTRGQVEDVLCNMASLHGTWWESPELSVLKTPVEHSDNLSGMLDMAARCRVGMERATSVISPSLHGQADRIWAGTQKQLEICTETMPSTLLHGDSHVGQTYVTADGRMGLTDWQIVMRGGWSYDVAYFVASACEPADRRAWEHSLLELYLDKLTDAGGKAPDFEEAFLRYRQSMFYGYSAWAFTIGRAWFHPKMQPVETCLAILRRTSAAIEDLDSFEAAGV